MTDGDGPPPAHDGAHDVDDLDQAVDDLWTEMLGSLGNLLDEWLDGVTEITEQGVDPAPLLYGLARVMRSAADQLDPATDTTADPGAGEGPASAN